MWSLSFDLFGIGSPTSRLAPSRLFEGRSREKRATKSLGDDLSVFRPTGLPQKRTLRKSTLPVVQDSS